MMIRTKYNFRIDEVILNPVKKGNYFYSIENTYPINYSKNIICSNQRKLSFKIDFNEDEPLVRLVNINVIRNDFEFNAGSYAMQDIVRKTSSIYDSLKLKVSDKGNISAVENVDELRDKWNHIKSYFKNIYKGNQVAGYILKKDQMLSSENKIIEDLSMYQNLGGLFKPLYRPYLSGKKEIISQRINSKDGTVLLDEELSLKALEKPNSIQLNLHAIQRKEKKSIAINGNYNFVGQESFVLENAKILIAENNGSQQFQNYITINKSSSLCLDSL